MTNVVEELTKRTYIAAPCTAKWEEMTGDERSRVCAQCDLSVLNAAELTDEEVLKAIMTLATGQRVCMRIFRRTDGTILTKDCPIGVRKLQVRDRLRKAAAWLAGGLSMLVSLSANAQQTNGCDKGVGDKKKPVWHSLISADEKGSPQKSKPVAGSNSSTTKPHPIPVMPGMIAMPAYTDESVQQELSSLKQNEKTKGPDSTEVAHNYQQLGMMYYWQRKYPEAKVSYEKAFDKYEKLKDVAQQRYICQQMEMLCRVQNDKSGAAAWQKRWQELSDPKATNSAGKKP